VGDAADGLLMSCGCVADVQLVYCWWVGIRAAGCCVGKEG